MTAGPVVAAPLIRPALDLTARLGIATVAYHVGARRAAPAGVA